MTGNSNATRRTRLGVWGLSGALAVGGLFGLSGRAHAETCDQSGNVVTCTYSNPSAAETFVVPANVTSAQFRLQGGSGGKGASPPPNIPADGGAGGGGGSLTATIPLTPRTVLRIYVGGNGGDGQPSANSCETGNQGGTGGLSGGIQTGGDGGDGHRQGPMGDQGCAGGGGGGGSFVMTGGQTLDQVTLSPGGAVPLLVAGGGGGGGGGSGLVGGAGGTGGGSSGTATAGGVPVADPSNHPAGGSPGASGSVRGNPGDVASGPMSDEDDAGGGGGGGYAGGGGGGFSSGGGGGAGHSPAGAITGTAAVGSPGSVSITYSVTDTAQCDADEGKCVVEPPAGEETKFKIVASGGTGNATLFGTLNGGPPPTCRTRAAALSPDWVQFGFTDARDGKTWSKRIRVTGTDPTTKAEAQRILAETQICFAAPYKFVVKRGETLTRVDKHWEGLLAHCRSDIVAEAKANQPDLARPCILNRSLVEKSGGWVVRVNYFVPDGELDPQGRSARKKKRR